MNLGPSAYGGNRLVSPYEVAAGVAATGFDRCTTASNHSNDIGAAGIDQTLAALDAGGRLPRRHGAQPGRGRRPPRRSSRSTACASPTSPYTRFTNTALAAGAVAAELSTSPTPGG